jgi:NTE family protein
MSSPAKPSAPARSELLVGLSEAQRETLLSRMRRFQLHRGEHLVRQGETANHVYYVTRGRFEVLRDGRHLVAEIGAGEPVGEIAFFGGLPRTADVVASRDSEVMELSREAFDQVASTQPEFVHSILRTLGRRLAATTASAGEMAPRIADSIGLCPAGGSPLPQKLVETLCQAFTNNDVRITVLRAADLPESLAADDEHLMAQWLGSHESLEGKLLLVTGDGNTAWDRAALRHCDQLLLCGRLREADTGPVALNAQEAYVIPLFRPRQIGLLLWRDSTDPEIRNTRHWLTDRPAHLHHHAALGNDQDFGRVARLLAGRALGAAFGGGGALGAGHVGILRALEGAGIHLDIVGGTSIGAVVAMNYSSGDPAALMMSDYDDFFVRQQALGRFNLPIYSLLDHRHLDACMQERYGDRRVEDLPISMFGIGANLSKAELEIVRSGLCWHALRISTAIPVALPPWINEQGQVLVDGGIMDNVPISVMRSIKSGPNLISMLSPGNEWKVSSDYNSVPTRLKLAWQMLTGSRKNDDYPRMGMVAARSMQVTSSRTFRRNGLGKDLLIEPPTVPGMGLLAFKLGRAQEAAGYEYMCRFLENLGGPEGFRRWRRGEMGNDAS